MNTQLISNDVLSKTFTLIVLLTGSIEASEAAMLEGIQRLDLRAEPHSQLIRLSLAAAMEAGEWRPLPRLDEMAEASATLCPSLRPVLALPSPLRRCFVLRLMAFLSRESCASLLHIEASQVDEFTGSAALALAGLVEPMNHTATSFKLLPDAPNMAPGAYRI